MEIIGPFIHPHPGHGDGIGHDDLLAAGNPAHQLDNLMVQDIDRGYDPHIRSSANAMKFCSTFFPVALLFSGWNWVP